MENKPGNIIALSESETEILTKAMVAALEESKQGRRKDDDSVQPVAPRKKSGSGDTSFIL